MSLSKMKKEDLELLSNKDITNLILEESKTQQDTTRDSMVKEQIEFLKQTSLFDDVRFGSAAEGGVI